MHCTRPIIPRYAKSLMTIAGLLFWAPLVTALDLVLPLKDGTTIWNPNGPNTVQWSQYPLTSPAIVGQSFTIYIVNAYTGMYPDLPSGLLILPLAVNINFVTGTSTTFNPAGTVLRNGPGYILVGTDPNNESTAYCESGGFAIGSEDIGGVYAGDPTTTTTTTTTTSAAAITTTTTTTSDSTTSSAGSTGQSTQSSSSPSSAARTPAASALSGTSPGGPSDQGVGLIPSSAGTKATIKSMRIVSLTLLSSVGLLFWI